MPVMFTEFGSDAFNARDDARGPGHAGALPGGPVARDLRAVGRQGPRRQRHRRPGLPVERRLVEVRAGEPPEHPRHERLVAQRRLPRRLPRRREQHERGVVGHHRQGRSPTPAASTTSTRARPTTRCARPSRWIPTRRAPTSPPSAPTSPASTPVAAELEARGDAAALQTDALSKVRLAGVRMEFETYSTGGEEHRRTPETDQPGTTLSRLPGLRPPPVVLRRLRGHARRTTSPAGCR